MSVNNYMDEFDIFIGTIFKIVIAKSVADGYEIHINSVTQTYETTHPNSLTVSVRSLSPNKNEVQHVFHNVRRLLTGDNFERRA